jgi:2-dehydropantoate 2-reductase
MRYVILGAGAVGGVIGSSLARSGHDVALVARGAHLEALRSDGLTLMSPAGTVTTSLPAFATVTEARPEGDDVVVVSVKGQDTLEVLREMAAVAPSSTSVVCAQNGVENERVALRLFEHVYGMCVMTPATHIDPGVVVVHAGPEPGVFDLGRWPGSVDDAAERVAADLRDAGTFSDARADIATLKWGKLLSNVHNAHEALVGTIDRGSELARRTRDEAVAVMAAAGVDVAAAQAARDARFGLLTRGEVDGARRAGGSSWQSLARGRTDIESDFLNGEIVMLGRLHSVATPVNELLRERADDAARRGLAPGSVSEAELLAALG